MATDPKWQKDAADQNFDYMFKLLIIGNSSVGKTSFLFRYADDSFTSAFVSTVGIDFKVKTVFRHDKRVKLQIWVSKMYLIFCIIPQTIMSKKKSGKFLMVYFLFRILLDKKDTALLQQPIIEERWDLF